MAKKKDKFPEITRNEKILTNIAKNYFGESAKVEYILTRYQPIIGDLPPHGIGEDINTAKNSLDFIFSRKSIKNPSVKAKKFIKKKIIKLRREGKSQKVAVGKAFTEARRKGYRVPVKKNPLISKVAQAKTLFNKFNHYPAERKQDIKIKSSVNAKLVLAKLGTGSGIEYESDKKI